MCWQVYISHNHERKILWHPVMYYQWLSDAVRSVCPACNIVVDVLINEKRAGWIQHLNIPSLTANSESNQQMEAGLHKEGNFPQIIGEVRLVKKTEQHAAYAGKAVMAWEIGESKGRNIITSPCIVLLWGYDCLIPIACLCLYTSHAIITVLACIYCMLVIITIMV